MSEKPATFTTEFIIKELRHMSQYPGNYGLIPGAAADEIERLQEEIIALKANTQYLAQITRLQ